MNIFFLILKLIFYHKFSPSNLSSSSSTNSFKLAFSNAFHNCSSEYTSNGSKLILKVPENKTESFFFSFCFFSYEFSLRNYLCLKSWRPIDLMFIPSIIISPSLISNILNRPSDSELLPAPVRPTIPICEINYFNNWIF